jgi:type I restriction enzyme, S subunit
MKKDWSLLNISDVTTIVNGGTPKTNIKEYWDGDIAWITPSDLGKLKNIIVDKTIRTISEEGLQKSSAKLFPKNSVILSTRAPIGHLAINSIPMSTNQGCRGIVPSEKLDNFYLYYFLKNNVTLLNSLGTGTTFKELSTKALGAVKIPIPPIEEQKQIVEILDKTFESIDQAKVNIEKNIENTKELFQSRLNEIFSQKGDGWEEKTLNQISLNLDNKRIPITKSKRVEGKIPYYGASGIVDYVEGYIFDEDLLLVSEDGANLLARTYPIAFSVSGKCWVNNHAHILKFKNKINQKFVEYYLNSIKLDDYISGMAQPKLNQTKLNLIPIPYPNLDIQTILINNIDKLNEQTKQLEKHYQRKLKNLEELKKSILQKAFRGELLK